MDLLYSLTSKQKFACRSLIRSRTFGEVSRIGWRGRRHRQTFLAVIPGSVTSPQP